MRTTGNPAVQAARVAQKLFGQVIDQLDGAGLLPAFFGLPAADRNRVLLTEPLGAADVGTVGVVNNSTTIAVAGPVVTTFRFSEASRKPQYLEASLAKVKLRIVTAAAAEIQTVDISLQKRNITTGVLTSLGNAVIGPAAPLIAVGLDRSFVALLDLSAAVVQDRFIGPGEVLELTVIISSDTTGGATSYQLFHSRTSDDLNVILITGA